MEKRILKIWKRYGLYIILVIGILIFFSMYRKQHRLYQKTLQLNHQLASEINKIQDKNNELQESIRQMQQADASRKIQQPTFINQQKYYRIHWKDYIQLSTNDYKTGLFGGISDLEVSVINQTGYRLEQVVVKVAYYRSNGDLFKTETVPIENIPAQDRQSTSAPESSRGKSVKVHFISITSRTMNFCWDESKKAEAQAQDPYRCVE